MMPARMACARPCRSEAARLSEAVDLYQTHRRDRIARPEQTLPHRGGRTGVTGQLYRCTGGRSRPLELLKH